MSTRDRLDEMLAKGGVPPLPNGTSDEASWDELASAIVAKATSKPESTSVSSEALVAPPMLVAEEGEPSAPAMLGVSTMSESERPKPSQRRPSLKELAERVSKTPPPSSVAPLSARASTPPVSAAPSSLSAVGTPLPSSPAMPSVPLSVPASMRTPLPSAPASTSTPLPSGSGPSAPPSAPPPSVSAPASVAPASTAEVVPIAAAKKPAVVEDKGGSGAKGGIVIALLGIAAAAGLAFYLTSQKPKPTEEVKAKVTQTAEAEETAKPAEAPTAAPVETAAPKDDGAIDLADLTDATAAPTEDPNAGGPAPAGTGAVASLDPKKDIEKPVRIDPDGTLDEEMKKRAGGDGDKKGAEPAAEDNRPKNVPDQPPQGSVTAAVGSVMGGARACVAGADDVSRATITFGSSGAVQSVSVSGWAAGKSAASCIQAALKGANVGAFSKPTYSFGVTIRP